MYDNDGSVDPKLWPAMDAQQKIAADRDEYGAMRLREAADALDTGATLAAQHKRTISNFESATTRGLGTAANMRQAADNLMEGVKALRGGREEGYLAHAYTPEEWAAKGLSADAMAAAPIGGTTVFLNPQHPGFREQDKVRWMWLHEPLHGVPKLRDQTVVVRGFKDPLPAYRFSNDAIGYEALKRIRPNDTLKNPDNLAYFANGSIPPRRKRGM